LAKTNTAKCQNHHQRVCKQTIGRTSFHRICCNTNNIHPKVEENIIITSGYASQPNKRAICQLVGCNTNELKAVTHVTI
jgi:hypothetical protein